MAGLLGKTIALKDLDGMLAVPDSESNKLHKAALDGKLEFAARQVETVRTQAVAVLNDPGNKAIGEKLAMQQWLDAIARQRAIGQILESNMARLCRTTKNCAPGPVSWSR